jgi:ABC-type polysaccharide/polyol phosphate transport system ATPase subunit
MIDLKFDRVSKNYRIRRETAEGDAGHPLLRKWRGMWRGREVFRALRDVSFEVARGEALGIIGHNGAGKSTILKLLAGITTPTAGEITINGRLSALIEVGSGFHPELTGRENIYLNGSILGMSRGEIGRKLDSIVDFAGVSQFLDTPVKRFSSGMYVRLGFSIAAHLEPDILLLDEVLAVGDATFQAKCIERIQELERVGTTIVFISHDLGAVERICDRVALMRQGEIVAVGPPKDVIAEYQQAASGFTPSTPPDSGVSGEAVIRSISFHDQRGRVSGAFQTGDPLVARVEYEAFERVPDAVFEVFFYGAGGELSCQFTTDYKDERITLNEGRGALDFLCPELGLQPDLYYVDVTVKHRAAAAGSDIDWQQRCMSLRVDPGKIVRGQFHMPHDWALVRGGERGSAAQCLTDELPSRM